MTHILSDSSIVPLNHSHICNQCTNRDFAALEAVEASETARHLCGIEPGDKRQMVSDDAGAVVHCTEYSGKRTCCPHLPGLDAAATDMSVLCADGVCYEWLVF